MLDELQQLYSFYSQYGVGFFGALYLYKSHVVYKLPKIKFYFQAAGTIPRQAKQTAAKEYCWRNLYSEFSPYDFPEMTRFGAFSAGELPRRTRPVRR